MARSSTELRNVELSQPSLNAAAGREDGGVGVEVPRTPEVRRTSSTFDALGRPRTQTTPDGTTSRLGSEAAEQVCRRTFAGAQARWEMLRSVRVSSSAKQKMRTALELGDLAVRVMRQNLRRRSPGASEEEIEAALQAWVRARPGAEHGDCDGRPVPSSHL